MQELTDYFKQKNPDTLVALLFGSVAKGKARPESDVDIAISKGRPLDMEERKATIIALADITGRPVDLIDLEDARGLILKKSLTEGIPLIPSDPATLERLLKRMVYDEEDFTPLINRLKKERITAFIDGK